MLSSFHPCVLVFSNREGGWCCCLLHTLLCHKQQYGCWLNIKHVNYHSRYYFVIIQRCSSWIHGFNILDDSVRFYISSNAMNRLSEPCDCMCSMICCCTIAATATSLSLLNNNCNCHPLSSSSSFPLQTTLFVSYFHLKYV